MGAPVFGIYLEATMRWHPALPYHEFPILSLACCIIAHFNYRYISFSSITKKKSFP